jgi:hypothetical protein
MLNLCGKHSRQLYKSQLKKVVMAFSSQLISGRLKSPPIKKIYFLGFRSDGMYFFFHVVQVSVVWKHLRILNINFQSLKKKGNLLEAIIETTEPDCLVLKVCCRLRLV